MIKFLDKAIGAISPERGLKRAQARHTLRVLNSGYSHHGASRAKKSLLGWLSRSGNADEDIVRNLETLRERSRDHFMGSPLATGALKTIRTNVVGSGLRLNASIDYEFLGLTSEEADAWEVHAEREFRMWAESPNCDAARRMTFGQLQGLTLLSALMSGDVFASLPLKRRPNTPYELCVALIESDRVSDPVPVVPGKDIFGGIELDDQGEAVAAYVESSKSQGFGVRRGLREWKRVEFFGRETGRRNLLHVSQDWERPGQRRGVPILSPVIETLKQLTRYTDAELMASVVSGMFTVFIKSQSPSLLADTVPLQEQVDTADPNSYELGNAAIVGLGDDEDIVTANPARNNASFDGFVTAVCRQVGTALEIPYELLVKHFTASYSASRAALLEAWKMFRMRRVWLVQSFCQPIYEEWLAEAVAKGRIRAPGFFEDPVRRAAWSGAEWYGPSQGHLNPLQEANAARVRIEQEISTREREAAEFSGQSWEDIHPVRAREEEARRRDKTIPQPEQFGMPPVTVTVEED